MVARMLPLPVIGRQSAGRDHAVHMGVELQILSPGVQHRQQADLGAEVLRIGGDFEQRGGAGLE